MLQKGLQIKMLFTLYITIGAMSFCQLVTSSTTTKKLFRLATATKRKHNTCCFTQLSCIPICYAFPTYSFSLHWPHHRYLVICSTWHFVNG